MTILRFDFQRQCVSETTGRVLNIGTCDDPAHLKEVFGARLINCDDRNYDVMLERPIVADCYFDCGVAPWPFEDDSAELVILGDILEHLTVDQQRVCVREAHRVAPKLCVTVPNDPRFLTQPNPDVPGASFHITHVTEGGLQDLLAYGGWRIVEWQTVDYGFVPEGYFVRAERA